MMTNPPMMVDPSSAIADVLLKQAEFDAIAVTLSSLLAREDHLAAYNMIPFVANALRHLLDATTDLRGEILASWQSLEEVQSQLRQHPDIEAIYLD